MNKRVAKKIASYSAWIEVKMMPYVYVRHKGDSIKLAIRKLRRRKLPVFYYEKPDYEPVSFSESYWTDSLAQYNELMLLAKP